MYLTYEEYANWGGTLDAPEYNLAELEARLIIDRYTFGRLKNEAAEDIPEAIKGMNRDEISNVDFDRLYKFLDRLGHYDYQQYILSPQVNQEEIEK